MKTKIILATLFVAMATMGFDCLNDPIIVTVNLDDVEVCSDVHPSGAFDETSTYVLANYVPESYRDNITGLRIYDVTIHVHHAPPTGGVTGSLLFIHGGTTDSLLTFSGNYTDFLADVSVLNSGGHIKLKSGFNVLMNMLTNPSGPPASVTLRGVGTASPGPGTDTVEVCCVVKFQASAKVN